MALFVNKLVAIFQFLIDKLVNLALYTIAGMRVQPQEAVVCNKQATSMSRGKQIMLWPHRLIFVNFHKFLCWEAA